MSILGLLTVLAVAASANGAALYTVPTVGVRSGFIESSGSDLDLENPAERGSDGFDFANFREQGQQTFTEIVNGDRKRFFGSIGQDGKITTSNPSFDVTGTQSGFLPQYPEHTRVNSGFRKVTSTIVNTVTRTHTLRVPSTSDVWVTSVTMMKMPVTQLTTQRSYVPVAANTVTSVIRITKTPIEVVTRTEEIYPTKTLVSVYTRFVTETETVELWQNIVHRATNYEVLTVPVVETQTLLQRLFTTTTVTRVVNVTSVQPFIVSNFVRSGTLPQTVTAGHTYGNF